MIYKVILKLESNFYSITSHGGMFSLRLTRKRKDRLIGLVHAHNLI